MNEETMTKGEIRSLHFYPLKGLSGQALERVELEPASGFPFDRMFGFARAESDFDPADPMPMPKHRFLMLMRDEQLAALDTRFDPGTWTLEIREHGSLLIAADMREESGRRGAEQFFTQLLGLDAPPRFVHAAPHRFTDVSVASQSLMNAVSLVNLDSVAAFGARIGRHVDPARFRANIRFSGWEPFSELEMVGREIAIGDARGRIVKRTRRCAATEVNPDTARRDMALPRLLMEHYGHADMGVYVEIDEGGNIAPGAPVRLV